MMLDTLRALWRLVTDTPTPPSAGKIRLANGRIRPQVKPVIVELAEAAAREAWASWWRYREGEPDAHVREEVVNTIADAVWGEFCNRFQWDDGEGE